MLRPSANSDFVMHIAKSVCFGIILHSVANMESSPGVVAGVDAPFAAVCHDRIRKHGAIVAEEPDAGLDLLEPAAWRQLARQF